MKLGYNELGYNELGYNEHILGQFGHFSLQINPVIKNPGYNKQKMAGAELFVITKFDSILITKLS